MTSLLARDPLTTAEIALRLLTAFACGAVIGLNRDFHRKPAGFRTFGLVSIGSAIVVLVMHQTAGAGADAVSRVIQGVLTGIGFLGAGVILHRVPHNKVAGLTTAAAVWLTAGLGVAAGSGQYTIAWLGLAFAMVLLLAGGPFERLLERVLRHKNSKGPSPEAEREDSDYSSEDRDSQ
jgi:putative Mg2+ transporter-C (MgtC) family protein